MTLQERIAIFHAYNGAMVKTEKGAAPFHIMTQDMVCVRYNSTDLGDWHLISDCQLLLTDLSLISDEHAVEVAKIAIGDEAKNPIIERKGGRVRVSMEYGVSRTICVISPCANQHEYGREYFYVYNETQCGMFGTSVFGTSKITDTLRAWNYNIGHGKYTAADLVNEGVVILNHENKGI